MWEYPRLKLSVAAFPLAVVSLEQEMARGARKTAINKNE
jgi:hypothetical protein